MPPRVRALAAVVAVCGVAVRVEADEAPTSLRLALGDVCPDRPAFEGALGAEGLHVGEDGAALRLSVRELAGDVAVELSDREGRVVLERVLPPSDCGALADAVALLVGRHLRGVDGDVVLPIEDPPAEEPPARPQTSRAQPRLEAQSQARRVDAWSFEARAGLLASTALRALDADLGPFVGARLGTGLLSTSLWAGWMRSAVPVAGEGGLVVDRIPLALGLGARFGWRGVSLGAHATGEAEVLRVRSDLPGAVSATRAAWRLGPVVSLAFEPVPRVSVGLDVGALARLWGYRFVVDGVGDVGGQAPIAFEAMISLGFRGGA